MCFFGGTQTGMGKNFGGMQNVCFPSSGTQTAFSRLADTENTNMYKTSSTMKSSCVEATYTHLGII